jgi:hypothetical protein
MFLLNRHLRGDHLEPLGVPECQAVVQCLTSQVAIAGEPVAISCVPPGICAPQAYPGLPSWSERMSGHADRVRLAARDEASKTMRLVEPIRHQRNARRKLLRYCAPTHHIRELGKSIIYCFYAKHDRWSWIERCPILTRQAGHRNGLPRDEPHLRSDGSASPLDRWVGLQKQPVI